MKQMRISNEVHKWLAKEKKRTGVPMAAQIERFIADKEKKDDISRLGSQKRTTISGKS